MNLDVANHNMLRNKGVELAFPELQEWNYFEGRSCVIIEYEVGKRKKWNILVEIASGEKK